MEKKMKKEPLMGIVITIRTDDLRNPRFFRAETSQCPGDEVTRSTPRGAALAMLEEIERVMLAYVMRGNKADASSLLQDIDVEKGGPLDVRITSAENGALAFKAWVGRKTLVSVAMGGTMREAVDRAMDRMDRVAAGVLLQDPK